MSTITSLVHRLEQSDSRARHEQLVEELNTLDAILGEESVHCGWEEDSNDRVSGITLLIHIHLSGGHLAFADPAQDHVDDGHDEDTHCQLQLDIPNGYPSHEEDFPRLALLAKYIGPFKVNDQLLEAVQNVFKKLSSSSSSSSTDPILYDGIQTGKEIIAEFYHSHISKKAATSSPHERCESRGTHARSSAELAAKKNDPPVSPPLQHAHDSQSLEGAHTFVVHSCAPIVDRKSVFIGHAIALADPKEVPRILQQLLSDKKIAKASHNIVAWRCEFNGCLHQGQAVSVAGPSLSQMVSSSSRRGKPLCISGVRFFIDNDDDGESAAGSRMLHLLNILDVKKVFVCVSRWFGGIHLGADRFKHINQATRDALMQGHFIPSEPSLKNPSPAHPHVSSSGSKKKR
ncbi:hypothetical protein PCASD_04464 [Puccinia coronata f. sp. avenae]|uniref:RWD domain-containing protein n=1 Tax=Puccinia coronata f. sp. avenae TaxID=200324 RepID=A0A2N5V349_9BASI|nr:hypothetical protein PCASD_04464 [Puccinia coronata f. sp. avenae]